MTLLIPVAMFGWIVFSIVQFSRKEPRDATVAVVVGGLLFLPVYAYPVPFLQEYDKTSAIAASLVIGVMASGAHRSGVIRLGAIDIPIIVWCFVSPVMTSLANGLGIYNGITNLARNTLSWGVFYWAGRALFTDADSPRKLLVGLMVGALIYIPFILFELRMSPQLSRWVYGFFPASFLEHVRYGGYRPIVFMQHGLMLSLWMAIAAISSYWLWRSKSMAKMGNFRMGLVVAALVCVVVLCKSVGALALLAVGLAAFSLVWRSRSTFALKVLLVVALAYIVFRISNILPIAVLEEVLEKYLDPERVQSAMTRLLEEDLFSERTKLRPLFGWGGYERGWPINPRTGKKLINMIDALWIIQFNTYGYLGLISSFLALGAGPWRVFSRFSGARIAKSREVMVESFDGIVLGLVVTMYILDSLSNGMHNPFLIVCAGALASYSMAADGSEARRASVSEG